VTRPRRQGRYGDFLVNAQGEDVVAGIRNTEPLSALGSKSPRSTRSSWGSSPGLKRTTGTCATPNSPSSKASCGCYRHASASERAAPRSAWQWTWVDDPAIALTHAEALQRTSAEHIEAVLHPQFAHNSSPVLAKGLAASPGAAVGAVCFTADDAAAAAARNEHVILVRNETSPRTCTACSRRRHPDREGRPGQPRCGCRSRLGKPAVVGAEALRISASDKLFRVGDTVVREGT